MFCKFIYLQPAAAFGRANLLDAIKQGGSGGLRKVEAPSASASAPLAGPGAGEGRPSTGRASLLDAIKKGSGQLRKVTTEEQEALAEEKKRSTSSVGGFGTVYSLCSLILS